MTAYEVQAWHTPPFEDNPDLGHGCREVNGSVMDAAMYYGCAYQTDGYYWRMDPVKAVAYWRKRQEDKAARKTAWQSREEQDAAFRDMYPELRAVES